MNISMVRIKCIFSLITHTVCNLTVNHKLQHNHAKTNLKACWDCIIVPYVTAIIAGYHMYDFGKFEVQWTMWLVFLCSWLSHWCWIICKDFNVMKLSEYWRITFLKCCNVIHFGATSHSSELRLDCAYRYGWSLCLYSAFISSIFLSVSLKRKDADEMLHYHEKLWGQYWAV